jgi:hypothetical protein
MVGTFKKMLIPEVVVIVWFVPLLIVYGKEQV